MSSKKTLPGEKVVKVPLVVYGIHVGEVFIGHHGDVVAKAKSNNHAKQLHDLIKDGHVDALALSPLFID